LIRRAPRPQHGPVVPTATNEYTKLDVWRAISAVGGLAPAMGARLWHVVGLECNLKRWAHEVGWGNGILID
jgi:hypothetical protein